MIGATNPLEAAPGSIRGEFGLEVQTNLVHGSDSAESAAREIGLFFPELVILASGSPQRRAILEQLGVDFRVEVPEVEEIVDGEPHELVRENALMKARAVDGERVVGADTAVVLDGRDLGKPADEHAAERFLRALSGRVHEVMTGIAVVDADGERSDVAVTRVRFRELGEDDLALVPLDRRMARPRRRLRDPAPGGRPGRVDRGRLHQRGRPAGARPAAASARPLAWLDGPTGVARLLHGPGPSRAAAPAPILPSQRAKMGFFSYLTGMGGRDMAVDLGTANTLVYVRGRGIVSSEPSVVAIDSRTAEVHAVGIEAKRMLGRTPGTIQAIRPLKDGVIADFDVTEQMLRHFIQKVHQNRWAHPRVVVCVPSGVTGVEKRAVEEACLSAGARQAYLIEEPMAAAIGAGLPVGEPTGNMVVDIGGGTSEVAVISLGGIVVSQSIRIGGDELDEAIINYVKREYKLMIGQQTAEEVKLEIGSAFPLGEEVQAEIRGRDLVSGLPKTIVLTSEEVRMALEEPLQAIIDAVKETLDRTPPELASDIMDRGIMLAGGGALLQGLDERLRDETQMPAHLAESPLTCVAVGSGRSLEEFEAIHRANKNSRTSRRR